MSNLKKIDKLAKEVQWLEDLHDQITINVLWHCRDELDEPVKAALGTVDTRLDKLAKKMKKLQKKLRKDSCDWSFYCGL